MTEHYLQGELYSRAKTDDTIFDFLQTGALDGIWYWDLESPSHEWMSPRFWELLGFDPSEKKHLASEWQDLIFPDDLKLAVQNFEKHCADENHPYDQTVRYRHKDGSTVWVRCRGIAIRDEEGKPIRMLGAHTELTALKLAEEDLNRKTEKLVQIDSELQEKSAFLDKVIETNAVSTWISDENGIAIRTNRACLEFFGTTEDEVIGKYDLLRDEELERQGFMPAIRRVFDEGITADLIIDYDFGSVDHVEIENPTHKIINSIYTPILDGQNRVSNVIVQAIDLTDLKRSENALREGEERLRNIGDNLPAGQIFQLMVRPDDTRQFTYISSKVEQLYECTAHEALADAGCIYDRILDEDDVRIQKESAKSAEVNGIFDQEFRVRRKSGEIRWHRSIAKPRPLKDGSVLFDGIDIDITDQKKIAQEKERLLGELDERVKELQCLYAVSRSIENPDTPLQEVLKNVVEILPPGWQYPEDTCARVRYDSEEFTTGNFNETPWKQSAEVVANGDRRGFVEVCYLKEKPQSHEGPFLKAERKLIDSVADRLGKLIEYTSIRDELKEKNTQLEHMATHDSMTGLPNRLLLYDRFAQNAAMCRRNKLKMGICLADADDFKEINDTFGHQDGDRVLKEISSRLRLAVREYDTISRIGGDEFAILLQNIENRQEVEEIIGRTLKNVKQPVLLGDHEVVPSLSLGVAMYPDDGETLDELLGKADEAMYGSKLKRKNQFSFYGD